MPPKWIICPKNKETILIEDCIGHCTDRCLTLPTIKAITQEREWTGNPSTTRLLNGTMLEFLKITKDYTVNPQNRAFALVGTKHHTMLKEIADELKLPSEISLGPDGHDVFDLIEPENDHWTLTDYKVWGSYRVARALGIVKSGKGKEATFITDPGMVDLWETELQLNHYRVMLEKLGMKIGRMQVQVTVRDGGLQMAKTRGIDFNIGLIPIKRLDDMEVLNYFAWKKTKLLDTLEEYKNNPEYLPEPCNDKESWDGNRCRGYCEVAQNCPKGIIEQGEEK